MAKTRSPSYPSISLREAVEKIKMVYDKDYQNKLPRPVVAAHMGYQSLNGKSLGVLAAIGKFGLLEGRADANWVSDLALKIIAHQPGTAERASALLEASRRPELFAELDAKFQNGKASDPAIRSYLMTQKFIPTAADMAIRSYRETKAFVSEESGGYDVELSSVTEAEATETPVAQPQANRPTSIASGAVNANEREFLRGPLSVNCSYRIMVSGAMGVKELGKLIRVLTLQRELLEDEDLGAELEAEDNLPPHG